MKGPIAASMEASDLDMICTSALANIPAVQGFLRDKPPHRSLAVLEVTASACDEVQAWEAALAAERAMRTLQGNAMLETVTDLRLKERRLQTRAAARMWSAFGHVEAKYGPIGEGCAKLPKREDEVAFVLGLFAGANALLQDKLGGGHVGVPADTIVKVGRAAECVDDETWWYAPSAIRAGWWVMVPGSVPEGIDPWEAMEEAATKGDASGVRVARAVQAQLAANAGRDDVVEHAIRALAEAKAKVPSDPDYLLLDLYSGLIVQQQSDLIWTKAVGSRTPIFGELPSDAADEAIEDPFGGGDPFGEDDPFAEPGNDAPADHTDKDPQ